MTGHAHWEIGSGVGRPLEGKRINAYYEFVIENGDHHLDRETIKVGREKNMMAIKMTRRLSNDGVN
jgi:hypothetical protein